MNMNITVLYESDFYISWFDRLSISLLKRFHNNHLFFEDVFPILAQAEKYVRELYSLII